MNFPKEIADYVRVEFVLDIGTTAVVVDDVAASLPPFPLLDLTDIRYKDISDDTKRHYVGRKICKYLRNIASREDVISDYCMNEYLEKNEIIRIIDEATKNAEFVMKLYKRQSPF